MDRRIEITPLMSKRDEEGRGTQTGLRERMNKRLYDASVHGNVDVLNELMSEDKLTLARNSVTCFDESPLHVAAMLGHLDFTKQLLDHQPDLASEVDSQGRSPLHLASARGYVEIVKLLLYVNADTCLVSDEDGRTPLHLAVMKGRVEVIEVLVRARPLEVAQYTSNQGETLLHLAVKHNKLEVLKKLNDFIRNDDFVNVKDDVGDTILHLATALKQIEFAVATALKKIETIKYLLSATGVKVNAMNGNGLTAMDIIEHMPRDLKGMEIKESLANAGALRTRNIPQSEREVRVNFEAVAPPSNAPPSVTTARPPSRADSISRKLQEQKEWLENMLGTLSVTATVIASMAYQAALNPPGGVWQDDKTIGNDTYDAGTSIMASNHQGFYTAFWLFNTISFVSSLAIILLIIGGVPLKKKITIRVLMAIMWPTVISMALAYLFSMMAVHSNLKDIYVYAMASLYIFMGLTGIVCLLHVFRFLKWIFLKVKNYAKRPLGQNQGEGNV